MFIRLRIIFFTLSSTNKSLRHFYVERAIKFRSAYCDPSKYGEHAVATKELERLTHCGKVLQKESQQSAIGDEKEGKMNRRTRLLLSFYLVLYVSL